MVMGLFAVFWLSFGVLQLPTLNLSLPYATTADPTGTASPAFNTDVGLYLIVWGFALFTFFIFTLKINTVFALIFGLVSTASWVLAGACESFPLPICFCTFVLSGVIRCLRLCVA
jgi:succinate-acetate transporter protein